MKTEVACKVADHLLGVREILPEGEVRTLRVLIDMALVEVGRSIARSAHGEVPPIPSEDMESHEDPIQARMHERVGGLAKGPSLGL